MFITIKKEENPEIRHNEPGIEHGSVFLNYFWLNALKKEDRIPIYLKFYRDNELVGLIAGLERPVMNSNSKQLFFFSGIACSDSDSDLLTGCKSALIDYATRNGFSRIVIKSYDHTSYIPAKTKRFRKFDRGEYVVDLTKDIQELKKGFDKNVIRLVKKTENGGALFKTGYSVELLDKLFGLLDNTHEVRTKKGYGSYNIFAMPFLDRDIMEKLLIKKEAVLFYVEYQNEIQSMQFAVTSNKRAYALLMGVSEKGYSFGIPSLLWYKAFFYLKDMGFLSFNLGGVPLGSKNKGLRRFKRSMGAELIGSCEEFTDFLIPPLSLLNPLLAIKRTVLKAHLPWKIKKFLIDFLDLFIKKRDEY